MITKIKQYLNQHPAAKFAAADIYIYFIHLLQLLLGLTPGFIRNPVFRLLLARCGKHVHFDYRVFIKFPWLVEMGETISIGDGAIIGAGSVVNRDVPPRCIAAGSPVRVIRELDPA